jgi:hypothetical protein
VNVFNPLVEALTPVVESLRKLNVPHFVGGSIASSYHGAIRSTMDVDLVCELNDGHVAEFVRLIGSQFYVNEAAVREAVAGKSSFNIIHLPTSFKVDVFVSRRRPFDIEAMYRAKLERIGGAEGLEVPIATAEDSIISKLEWYRLGNETSERQWDDVSRLIRLLGDAADINYLKNAAASVGVSDLLLRLLTQQ